MNAETNVTIEQPPAAVFAALIDIARHPEWAGAVREVRAIEWRDGGIGSTFEQVTSALGRTVVAQVTVTDFEPDVRFGARAAGPVPAHMIWELAPTATGTRVRMSLCADPGPLGGFVAGFMKSHLLDQMTQDLQRLKNRVEAVA